MGCTSVSEQWTISFRSVLQPVVRTVVRCGHWQLHVVKQAATNRLLSTLVTSCWLGPFPVSFSQVAHSHDPRSAFNSHSCYVLRYPFVTSIIMLFMLHWRRRQLRTSTIVVIYDSGSKWTQNRKVPETKRTMDNTNTISTKCQLIA